MIFYESGNICAGLSFLTPVTCSCEGSAANTPLSGEVCDGAALLLPAFGEVRPILNEVGDVRKFRLEVLMKAVYAWPLTSLLHRPRDAAVE
jgi:hypothetical protein